VAENKATFAVELKDQVSGPAKTAASAMASLQSRIQEDTAALRQMEAAMRAIKQSSVADIDVIKKLQSQIRAKQLSLASANEEYVKLGGNFKKTATAAFDWGKTAREAAASVPPKTKMVAVALAQIKKPANDASLSLDALSKSTKKIGLGGPDAIMDLVGAVSTLPGALITAGAALVAFSAAVIGLGVVAVGSLIMKALDVQEELEGVSQSVIDLAKKSPVARSEIQKMAKDLEATGLKGAALQAALEKAVGKAGAGKSMLGLSTQIMKAKENISLLFAGIKTGPLLEATQKFLGLLDESSSTGQALKTLFETLLNPIVQGIADAGPSAAQFFKGMVIGALKATIIFLTLKNNIKDAVGELDIGDYVPDWKVLGEYAFYAAGAIGLVAVAVAAAIGAIMAIPLAVVAVGVAIGKMVGEGINAFMALPAAISSVNNFIISRVAAMIDAGLQFAAGLAQGIRDGISEVITAATDVAQGAVDAVKKKLKIASPSKVMAELGVHTSAGMAQGMDQGAPAVRGAGVGLGEDAKSGAKQGASGGGRGPLIGELTIHVSGGGGNTGEIVEAVKRGIEMALEDAAHAMGAPLEAAI